MPLSGTLSVTNMSFNAIRENKMANRAKDKKYLYTTSAEPMIQIQNNFTEMFLIMPSTKILLHRTKCPPVLKVE